MDADKNQSNTKMMETEPGGENTQYESIKDHTIPVDKEEGQMGKNESKTESPETLKSDKGEKTADNIRYGQNISESGMGGMTTTSTGSASQGGGYGGTDRDDDSEESGTRRSQGYGGGSGVGG